MIKNSVVVGDNECFLKSHFSSQTLIWELDESTFCCSWFERKRSKVLKYFLILDIKRMMIELRSVILRHSEKGKSFGCNIFMAYDLHVSAMFTSSSKDDNMCRMFLITNCSIAKKSVTPSTSAASYNKSLHYLEQRYQKQRTRKFSFFNHS